MKEMKLLSAILLGIFSLAHADPVPRPSLNGVTIAYIPFLSVDNGTFSGFCADLIEKIGEKAGFDHKLHLVGDGAYGILTDGKWNGMIGEVANKKADFAIADITVTDKRKEAVTFTEPFMSSQISAVIQKQDVGDFKNLEELVAGTNRPGKRPIKFVVLQSGSTKHLISTSSDPVYSAINENIKSNGEKSFMKSNALSIDQVKAATGEEGLAALMESYAAEFVTGSDCNLAMLPDVRGLFTRDYAIALPKDSPHLEKFNQAIKDLKADGTIDQLKSKYWVNKCK